EFKILTELDSEEIFEGMIIDYSVKPLFGILLHWQTEISQVQNQKFFTDKQTKGPYKVWEHTHTFTEVKDGVIMNDVVNYKLPFRFIGDAVNAVLVSKKIRDIFGYRKTFLEKYFKSNGKNIN
ncbi:MAG: SRPBCC family protein, partial [Bacteroidetes bacterium]|nr:SRPBCC family protein [Bacteroidota bacterium]